MNPNERDLPRGPSPPAITDRQSKESGATPKTAAENQRLEAHRAGLQRALERDFQRHDRRQDSHHSFWRWMGVLGMVGWPIALMTVGGALLGHYFDVRFHSGIQFTLLLLTIGAVISSFVAWKAMGADR
jgi:ATP synthase protein I